MEVGNKKVIIWSILYSIIALDAHEFKSIGKHYYIWMEEDEEFIKKLMTMLSGGR